LREEQEEMIRRLEEEQYLLNQQIADQRRQLEENLEKDRQWQMRLRQDKETHRRFGGIGHPIDRASISM
jgi:hypothetical protein